MIATLDAVGTAIVVAAVVVLVARDETDAGWWAAVGLSAVFCAVTTGLLVRWVVQRRTFVAGVQELTVRLAHGRQDPDETVGPGLLRFAGDVRAQALASGDMELALRLDRELARYRYTGSPEDEGFSW